MADGDEALLIERIRSLASPLEPEPTNCEPQLTPLGGIRAVLFDIYGTLVISGCGDIGLTAAAQRQRPFLDAWRAAGLDTKGIPPDFDGPAALTAQTRAAHARSRAAGVDYPEVDILDIWRRVLDALAINCAPPTLRLLAVEYELRTNPVWPMPGLSRVIATLAARGLVLGVVSNAQFYTPLTLQAFLGRPMDEAGFDPRCCAFSYREGIAKPATEVYTPALAGLREHHGIAREAVLYIGNDMRNDVRPAHALGCPTALFAGDARSLRLREDDPLLRDISPDRVVTSLTQLTVQLLPDH
jgi:putative hydrolase of the HAD superfamily